MHYAERLGWRHMEKPRCMSFAQNWAVLNVYLWEGKGGISAAVRAQEH